MTDSLVTPALAPSVGPRRPRLLRLAALVGSAGLAVLLSGCVVAPLGPPGFRHGPQVYVEPAPVVVVPARPYGYYGHRGYHGYRGHGGYRGYRGHEYSR